MEQQGSLENLGAFLNLVKGMRWDQRCHRGSVQLSDCILTMIEKFNGKQTENQEND